MTTSKETDYLNHPVLRRLVEEANSLPLADRITLFKGLIQGTADSLRPEEFQVLIAELRLKGERFYEALEHPGEGRLTRQIPGEREIEGR